jgi:hypothetical protein
MNLDEPCIPVFKPHVHKLYILRHCTKIVYIMYLLRQILTERVPYFLAIYLSYWHVSITQ